MANTVLASNRKAFHNYEILERLEAGIVLSGHEVKSARNSNISIIDSIVSFKKGEAFLEAAYVAPYTQMSSHVLSYDAKRSRKLLLHKTEALKFSAKVKEKGLTAIPLEVYLSKNGKIKVLIALARGKNTFDKKEALKKKDIARELQKQGFSAKV
ncbi:MAG: SsrA-binding protein SmpB [Elusimicrobia bacterium]|nr:SsrA-binding protein SmpB [Elusimicrobiota bacterium]